MDDGSKFYMLRAMSVYGGGFAASLAAAWSLADSRNSARLAAAFHDLVAKYGPGSMFFDAVKAEHERQAEAADRAAVRRARRAGVAL